jgi:hypothetical protein
MPIADPVSVAIQNQGNSLLDSTDILSDVFGTIPNYQLLTKLDAIMNLDNVDTQFNSFN